MLLCAVCKTECCENTVCPECGFSALKPEFLNKDEAKLWQRTVVWPYRIKYWRTQKQFKIEKSFSTGYIITDSTYSKDHREDSVPNIVRIPYGIQTIGKGTFERCMDITEVHLPATIKTICDYAFSECYNLKKVTLKDGVILIGSGAFDRCTQLKEINLPNTTKEIKSGAFRCCSALDEVIIPSSVEIIEAPCFFHTKAKLYCEAPRKPEKWDQEWLCKDTCVVWWKDDWQYIDGKPQPIVQKE